MIANKKLFLASVTIFVLLSFQIIGSVGASSELWSQTYGGESYETAQSVIETSDGGYAIAGGTTSFGAGEYDFWLIKTDQNGNMEWNQTYGGTKNDIAYSVIETSDGGYALVGSTNGTHDIAALGRDFWLVKTDAYGNMEWNQKYGGIEDDYALSLVELSGGGYVIAGVAQLIKTDTHGNVEWSQEYPGIARSIVKVSDGGFALAGNRMLVKTDELGNIEWNQTYEAGRVSLLVETSDGGYALAGYTRSFGAILDDFWLVKTDQYGSVEWNHTYGGIGSEIASSLVKTSDGGYAMAGHTDSFGAGRFDFWLVKTDAYGNVEWNQTYGGEGYEDANSLVQTSDGGYVLAGAINSIYPSSDWWIIKTDAQGIPEFSSWIILPLFFTATLSVIVIKRRLFSQRS